MIIANPIYDSVFKYMLTNDPRVAKLFLSKLLNKKIVNLILAPTEIMSDGIKKKKSPLGRFGSMTVMHLDFAATIVDEDGNEDIIIIEMQKAKLIEDIMRFRHYLGAQYANSAHKYLVNDKFVAKPIYPIYILGHTLSEFTNEAIKVERVYKNAITNDVISGKSRFIDGLTHDALIIQIPSISARIEKEGTKEPVNRSLQELLTIFDQDKYSDTTKRYLNIESESIPKWLKPIAGVLKRAGEDSAIRQQMEVEDDYLEQFEEIEKTLIKKDQALEKKDQALEENKQALEEKDQALEKKNQEQEKSIQLIMNLANISREEAVEKIRSENN